MNGRSKNALFSTVMAFAADVVAMISGFILPKLILNAFGSTYNGLTTSITQFLSFAVLLRSGVSGATRAALYKPLHDKDKDSINAIMSATNHFMHKIGLILAGLIISFACIYPFFVRNEFSWLFTFSLFLTIGMSTFAEAFWGITYSILLQADQKLYIYSFVQIFAYILSTVLAVVLIHYNMGIHIVKLGSTLAFTIQPIILNVYVRYKYNLNLSVTPNNTAIKQRWDAFFHQAAGFVMNNTDVIVLTIFSNMKEVSVYSVYHLVISGVNRIIVAFSYGLEAAFGSIMAEDNKKLLKDNFYMVEYALFSLSTFMCICAVLLITDFVKVYTQGISDVDYYRPIYAVLIVIGQFFNSIRQPYQIVIQAAGHYKQTKKYVILESIINIMVSLTLVRFGLIGVAIGTVIAIIFRTMMFSLYISKHIIYGTLFSMFKRIFISIISLIIVLGICNFLPFYEVTSYFDWFIHAVIIAVISFIVIIFISILCNKKDLMFMINKLLVGLKI